MTSIVNRVMTYMRCGESRKPGWDLGKYEVVVASFLRPIVAIPENLPGDQGSMMQCCMKLQPARAESILLVIRKYEAVFWSHNPNGKPSRKVILARSRSLHPSYLS